MKTAQEVMNNNLYIQLIYYNVKKKYDTIQIYPTAGKNLFHNPIAPNHSS